MFGKKKDEANSAEMRKAAIAYVEEQMLECEGSCDLGVVLGAAELAKNLNLITPNEYLKYHNEAFKRHADYTKAKKEKEVALAAQRKAEKAAAIAAAKAAKQK